MNPSYAGPPDNPPEILPYAPECETPVESERKIETMTQPMDLEALSRELAPDPVYFAQHAHDELERLRRENARLRNTIDMLGTLDRLLVEGVMLEVRRMDKLSYGVVATLTHGDQQLDDPLGCGNSLDEALWRLANPNKNWNNW